MIEFTNEQKDIISYDIKTNKNILLVEALAGCTKTTTLIEFIKNNPNIRFLFTSFNKGIINEVKNITKKMKNVDVYTINAFAMKKTFNFFKDIEIKKITEEDLEKITGIENYFLLQKIKNEFNDFCSQLLNLEDFIDKRFEDIFLKNDERFSNDKEYRFIVPYLKNIYNIYFNKKNDTISHNIYLKYFIDKLDKYTFSEYDVLLIDESQDLNELMFKLANKFINDNKGLVCVGDSNQSIMGFLNNINIIEKIKENSLLKDRITIKYLTKSFRFEKNSKIEKYANLILNHRKQPIEGNAYFHNKIIKDTLYVARTNKCVFDKISEWINLGKRFKLIGGMSSFNINQIKDVFYLLTKDFNKIKNKYILEFKNLDKPFNSLYEMAIKEKNFELSSDAKIAKKIFRDGSTPDITFKSIEKMNNDDANEIIGTIHKTKGMGFDKVILINNNIWKKNHFLGFNERNFKKEELNQVLHNKNIYKILDFDNKDFNIQEELNLLYVGITRAKIELSIQDKKYYEILLFLKDLNILKFETINIHNEKKEVYLYKDFIIFKKDMEIFKELLK